MTVRGLAILTRNAVRAGPVRWLRRLGVPWWLGYGLSWVLPVSTLGFLLTGPHPIGAALAWTLPVWLLIAADRWSPVEERVVPQTAPKAFFDGLLYGEVLLQALNLLAMGQMVSALQWSSGDAVLTALVNLLAVRILAGTNACCSVIAPAHELIHRRARWQRRLGRWLLLTVFLDPFFIAHRLGHHARLGQAEDPSTAAVDEGYESFFRRSVRRQWQIAFQARPRSAVFGLAVQLALVIAYGLAFGGLALFMWVYVSWAALRLLEAVNYFQHFGLGEMAGRPTATAWRCGSAVSLFLFFGLTRHADHHRRPAVTYPELQNRELERAPCLRHGYLWTAIWVKNDCRGYRAWAMGVLEAQAAR